MGATKTSTKNLTTPGRELCLDCVEEKCGTILLEQEDSDYLENGVIPFLVER
jgi:hypothetical protein